MVSGKGPYSREGQAMMRGAFLALKEINSDWGIRGKLLKVELLDRGENLSSIIDSTEKLILFFHSEHCGPCKLMMPDINSMQEKHSYVIAVDISEHMELAKKLNVRATPTTLLIKQGQVKKILLGRQSRKHLNTLLEK